MHAAPGFWNLMDSRSSEDRRCNNVHQGGSLTKTCHAEITFPLLLLWARPRYHGTKLSLGELYLLLTLPSKTAPVLG